MNLKELIPEYAENKAHLDGLKKIVDKLNTNIKQLMKDEGITETEEGGYKAVYSVQDRATMNEDKLLKIIKASENLDVKDAIQTKEYVDMDILERLIYKQLLPDDLLDKISTCQEHKEVVTLRISKVKEGK